MEELQNKIEAILFASGKGVDEDHLAKFCEEKPAKIKKALTILTQRYYEADNSLHITKHNNKWKLSVKGRYTPYIQKIVSETELPRTILKTLALVAYKSPVLQSDIIHMRGQSAYEHIKELVKEKLITKDESGRSYILKITDKFYNYFDVEGDEEIRDIFENLRKKQQQITELEIINIAEEQEKNKNPLGNLEIINEKEEQETLQPIRREKTEKQKEEETNFLNDIDSRIGELSKRIETPTLPTREEPQQEEILEEEKEKTSKEEAQGKNAEEEQENFL